ncbi:diacylglycerol kinase family protein [Draconibacterium halophilum]|uniref:Diacylglycerol kinase family protein n=1 Tax=Draconibacterium halophilum TaxID=2706887 RepID=A0A6C0RFL7_9BACT|nr:diacylglycerol kinase family protein [Draconibacterium halophilum]QIA08766.1 diacylglycerol kinase family protein [Draconibacterium halophilum]
MKTSLVHSVNQRLKSFQHAFHGIISLWKTEIHFRIHLVIACFVLILGWVVKLELTEWIFIIFAIGFVLGAEAFNSGIERICNFMCAQQNINIKVIKDISAAAVVIATVMAAVAGILIFLPKL